MLLQARVAEALRASASIGRPVSRREVWRLQASWRAVYAARLFRESGAWIRDSFDWHVFSFDLYPSKQGAKALQRYARVAPCDYVVLSASARSEFGFVCSGQPPVMPCRVDVLMFPESLDWTMAFTHEPHCGPYFATSSSDE